jgi:hypothetical protein
MTLGKNLGTVGGHNWYRLPSKFVERLWCTRCGCLAEGDLLWAMNLKLTRWDWQFTLPGNPVKVIKSSEDVPKCPNGVGYNQTTLMREQGLQKLERQAKGEIE